MQKKIIYSLTLFFLLLPLAGCDIFDTREAETPEQPRDNYETAYSSDILLDNLVNALRDKNTQNYLASFSDSNFSGFDFAFDPSAGSALRFPELLNNWDKSSEESYFNNFVAVLDDNDQVILELTEPNSTPYGDSLLYSASYFLTLPAGEQSQPEEYRGELKFKMTQDSRLIWTIYYWQDIKNSDYPTWSELKGLYY